MIEKDAKEKWCHRMQRMPDAAQAAKHTNCIGSKCMAWRWTHGGPSTPPNSGDPGYCGLAGKP